MPEKNDFELPRPEDIIFHLSHELSVNAQKEPVWGFEPPTEKLFPEEASTFDGRYIALSCLDQISYLSLKHTPPGAPLLLTPPDVRWIYRTFRQSVEEAWDLPEPVPEFTLANLFGASRRRIAWLQELSLYRETTEYDPQLKHMAAVQLAIWWAVQDSDPDPEPFTDP